RTTTMLYDAADNVLAETTGIAPHNPQVVTTSYTYDNLNRAKSVGEAWTVNGQQRTTTLLYDAVGNLLSETRPRSYDADASGMPVTNPVRLTTSYGYDAHNRRTQVIDAWGDSLARTTTTLYDAADNVVGVVDPLGRTTSYAYDLLNRATTMIE